MKINNNLIRYQLNIVLVVIILFFMLTHSSCSPGINENILKQQTPAPSESQPLNEISTPQNTTESIQQASKNPVKEIQGLVRIDEFDSNIIVDLKYATEDNFINKKVYPANICVLRQTTAEKLTKANNEFMKSGYRIKIWDGYRPPYVQQIFWNVVQDPRYVAEPGKGSSAHDTGCTVDITLVDKNGDEVIMPTGFDDFSIEASRKYTGSSNEAKQNLNYLTNVMTRYGFTTINSEWWEFRDSDIKKYFQIDIKLEKFLD